MHKTLSSFTPNENGSHGLLSHLFTASASYLHGACDKQPAAFSPDLEQPSTCCPVPRWQSKGMLLTMTLCQTQITLYWRVLQMTLYWRTRLFFPPIVKSVFHQMSTLPNAIKLHYWSVPNLMWMFWVCATGCHRNNRVVRELTAYLRVLAHSSSNVTCLEWNTACRAHSLILPIANDAWGAYGLTYWCLWEEGYLTRWFSRASLGNGPLRGHLPSNFCQRVHGYNTLK